MEIWNNKKHYKNNKNLNKKNYQNVTEIKIINICLIIRMLQHFQFIKK